MSSFNYRNDYLGMMKEVEVTYYSDDRKTELRAFAENYDTSKKHEIEFLWNGLHAKEFEDKNFEFRRELSVYISLNDGSYPVELYRDILVEASKCSVESWGIEEAILFIGEKLLKLGDCRVLKEFCIASCRTMDVFGELIAMDLTDVDMTYALNWINAQLESTTDSNEIRYLESGKKLILIGTKKRNN